MHRPHRKILDLLISDLWDVAINLLLLDHSVHKNISIMFFEIEVKFSINLKGKNQIR